MIRGILGAVFVLCMAIQTHATDVMSTCNITPPAGENSQNRTIFIQRMQSSGIKNPSDAQIRCLMNTPAPQRLAKLQQMVAGQQGQTTTGQIVAPPVIAPPSPITVSSDITFIKLQGQLIYVKLPGNAPYIGINPALYSSIANMITPTLKCSEAQPCTLTYTNQFQSYTSRNETKSLPVYSIQGTPSIIDGNPSAPLYPQLSFDTTQRIPLRKVTDDTSKMATTYINQSLYLDVSPNNPSEIAKMATPTLICLQTPQPCKLVFHSTINNIPFYKASGTYTIADTSVVVPPENIAFGPNGIPLTKTPLENNHLMVLYPHTQTYIAIRINPDELSKVLNKNKPTLTCNANPGNTCTLLKTGITVAHPQKITYVIQGSYTIGDAEPLQQGAPQPIPAPGGNPQQGGIGGVPVPAPAPNQIQYAPTLTLNQDATIPVQNIGMTNQVMTKRINPDYFMMIELDPALVNNVPNNQSVSLKCTNGPCMLKDSGRRTGTPIKPIYTVTGGTFVLADTSTPTQGGGQVGAGGVPDTTSPPPTFESKNESIQIMATTDTRNIVVLAKPLAGTDINIIRLNTTVDDQAKLMTMVPRSLKCTNCKFTPIAQQSATNPYPRYDMTGTYTFTGDPIPKALTLDTTGVIITPVYTTKKPRAIGLIYSDAKLNGQSIKIGLSKDLRDRINELNVIKDYDSLRLRCVDKAGCPLNGPDANGRYTISGNAIITTPDDRLTTTIEWTFKKDAPLSVTYGRHGYADPPKNTIPQLYVKYGQSTFQLSSQNIQNPEFIASNIFSLISSKPFKMTCTSEACFTLSPKPGYGYSQVYGKFKMSK